MKQSVSINMVDIEPIQHLLEIIGDILQDDRIPKKLKEEYVERLNEEVFE